MSVIKQQTNTHTLPGSVLMLIVYLW